MGSRWDRKRSQPRLWEYYDRRVEQGVPGLSNAVAYWSGLGVETSEQEIAAEAMRVEQTLRSLPPRRFLEVGAGPGTFTGLLPGPGLALDQSQAALCALTCHAPDVPVVRGDALRLPFGDGSADRLFAAHIYGLLGSRERAAFLKEARRVAGEIVVLDAGRPPGVPAEHWQDRSLPDGTEWRIFRRHFEPGALAEEIGGRLLFGGRFYVLAVATLEPSGATANQSPPTPPPRSSPGR
ncbi:MAG TPA: class I SAM-dependent methyltransferase [Acidimicrobiales bacterium]|nr:class I SAM-dependent methyltransferase [Acidimicrobiales bacterium]